MSEQIEINDKDIDRLLDFRGVDNAGGSIFYYKGEPFTGVIRAYYDNGQLLDEVEYLDGHVGGVSREFYPNGQIKAERYKYFGRMDKYYKGWDEEGNLIIHTIFDDGKRVRQILP